MSIGNTMILSELLQVQHDAILTDAFEAVKRSQLKNYVKAGEEHIHQRLKALFVLTVRAIKERNLGPMIAHAETVAHERFSAGYDLSEVQTAFNVLEETIWMNIIKHLPATDFAEALGLVSTVLGAGKDALARRYVSLASQTKSTSLNLQSIFSGTEGM
jgi:hypothetical protein